VALTVKGGAAAVVRDAEAYERLLDLAARADAEGGISLWVGQPHSLRNACNGSMREARRAGT
jgi:hypothetical protein